MEEQQQILYPLYLDFHLDRHWDHQQDQFQYSWLYRKLARMCCNVIRSRLRVAALIMVFGLVAGCQNDAPNETKQTQSTTINPDTFSGAMVLAISWQPGFCETRPRLRECKSQTPDRYDANHFTLHGLWPQPGNNVYCDVSKENINKDKRRKWGQLQSLELSNPTRQQLIKFMPGVQSFLHRHEWIKHGTCYASNPETYYQHSLALMDDLNRSVVQELFANSAGKMLTNKQIRAAFDKAYGKGVGKRVRVSCKRDGERLLITELTLGLKGPMSTSPDISALALASPSTKPGCPSGVVDRVGLQ